MTPSSADLNSTLVTTGHWLPGYEFLGVIGTGGFGTVFKARQFKLDRVVALKVFQLEAIGNPTMAARFEQEAVTLARFQHPNIVQVYDYGYHDGRLYIAMELLEGEDLSQRLQRHGPLSERLAWAIARQAAVALEHAATHGVVHRDVKPANLYLSLGTTGLGLPRDVPMVKVTDFGLALTKWDEKVAESRLTDPGTVMGTPVYMAPEQYRGDPELNYRVDIYGLGATVFHALAGRPPFDGTTIWQVMAKKLAHVPKAWPEASPESVALLQAMMAPEPRHRIGTYKELIERIDQLAPMRDLVPPPLADSGRPAAAPPAPARKRWRGVAVAVGVIAVLAVDVAMRLYPSSAPPAASPAPAGRYVSHGDQEVLFTRDALAQWLPPMAGGFWLVEADDEGAPVLTGTGFTHRTFTAAADYRVLIGLDVHKAAAAEVHFALPAHDPDAGRRFVLRVSKVGGAVFGARDGDRGAFRALGVPVPFPSSEWLEGRRPYVEVRLQRAGGAWAVWFNGTEAGRAADDGGPKAAEVRLFAEGGPVRVDSVVLERLAKAD